MAQKTGVGDCDEFTALFVTLCRAKNIPAKWAMGYVTGYHNVPYHSWPEVYFEKYGWVTFDPTFNQKKDFDILDSYYLFLANPHNDTVLKNKYFYQYNSDEQVEIRTSFIATTLDSPNKTEIISR